MPRRRSNRNLTGSILILALLGLVLYVVFSGALSGLGAPKIDLNVTLPAITLPPVTLPAITFQAPALTLPPPAQATLPGATPQAGNGWYQVYFTDPAGANAAGPDIPLVQAIDAAQQTVDVAVYNIGLGSVGEALIRADERGVRVRVVMESDNMDGAVVRNLQRAGVPLVGDRREGLMHNKFVVIDAQQVWTGSMNLTQNGVYDDNNNMIQIVDPKIAADYAREFEEMFTADQFGAGSPADTPYPQVMIDSTLVEVYFSPDDSPGARVVELLNKANESITFMIYSFTSDDIAGAMLARAKAGVSVAGVVDDDMAESNTGAEYPRLKNSGIDVRLDGNPGLMHHKVIIIDRSIVITGSYNFTASAENRNDENLIILYNADIAARYLEEFARVQQQAAP